MALQLVYRAIGKPIKWPRASSLGNSYRSQSKRALGEPFTLMRHSLSNLSSSQICLLLAWLWETGRAPNLRQSPPTYSLMLLTVQRCSCLPALLPLLLLTRMLLVANLAISKLCKKPLKWLKPSHIGTHEIVLSECYPMNTKMTGIRWFSKIVGFLCFGRK